MKQKNRKNIPGKVLREENKLWKKEKKTGRGGGAEFPITPVLLFYIQISEPWINRSQSSVSESYRTLATIMVLVLFVANVSYAALVLCTEAAIQLKKGGF